MNRLLSIVVIVICALGVGCAESVEDQVLAQYKRGEEAIAAMDGAGWRATMSTQSVGWLQEELRLALDASLTETRALAPSKMEMVLALRNRLDAQSLRSMSVDSLLTWMIEQDFASVDADYGVYPCGVKFSGDTATVQMGMEVESSSRSPRLRTGRRGRGVVGGIASLAGAASKKKNVEPIEGYTLTYVNIDGFWYSDNSESMREYDQSIRDAAKEAGVPVDRYLSEREKEAHGSLKPTIWLPVGR
ncbi:MAG: hypothetical protein KIT19_11625 [Phycisphaeraceae bacterium]|nr:hypothetical protein [Phycisphaeraceae bacterium]